MTEPVRDLSYWRRVLHNAASVQPGHARYDEARRMVALATNRIRMLNREASEREVETPSAGQTFGMSAVANVAGDVASTGVSALETLPEVGPLLKGTGFTSRLDPLLRQLAGRVALDVTGTDPAAYERGQEAHPVAAAAGEMAGPTLMALFGGKAGVRPAARAIDARLTPLPPAPPPRPRGFVTNQASAASAAPVSQMDPISRLLALLRRRSPPPASVTQTPPIGGRASGIDRADELAVPTFLRPRQTPPVMTDETVDGLRRLLANPRTSQELRDAIRLELSRRAGS